MCEYYFFNIDSALDNMTLFMIVDVWIFNNRLFFYVRREVPRPCAERGQQYWRTWSNARSVSSSPSPWPCQTYSIAAFGNRPCCIGNIMGGKKLIMMHVIQANILLSISVLAWLNHVLKYLLKIFKKSIHISTFLEPSMITKVFNWIGLNVYS